MEVYDELEKALKEIERLKEDNEYLNKVNIELSTEKNRLNNIINELEKICKDHIDIKIKTHCGKYYFDVEDILETIEALKENKND